ncbi:MFS transporter [Bradyrhizobium canariense]|uniref:Predicted arabinose efflux permease, MFS family n=1 Tax=Bradyrhizobium canariense TaxID=255045 RepID=A0A1H1N383_9BRAD|nr:MFS transporter [Bradyrhizobium canariense]SDR93436.1 Predicted arabinose efflux permease, MFS family [Bradyrhizobium canariense]
MSATTSFGTGRGLTGVDCGLRLRSNLWGSEALRNRWGILAVLFLVRLTMGFQFQSVAAVAPLLGRDFGVGLADIGILIGLYFTPGVVLALPGGAIGQRFGDKATVLGALLLMLIGGVAMALSTSWSGQIAGRLIAGAGGVLLNVQMTKMVADWFAGHEIATAMAIFVNSWPAGIAVALLTLPSIGTAYGVGAVHLAVVALIGLATALLAAAYRPPPNSVITAATSARLDRNTVIAVIIAGLIWGLFNVGIAAIFSFGPSMLVEHGWSVTAAGSAISIVLWLTVISVPVGGFLADRTKRPEFILVAGCILFAALMILLSRSGAVIAVVIALGLACGLPAGPILGLPARVLQPGNRAVGMGLFFTVYYAAMMLGPAAGGACAKWAGTAGAALDFGAAMILACPLILWGFNRTPAAVPKAA